MAGSSTAATVVIVIEQKVDVSRNADWIVDLGQDGGSRGGEIVFTGTPAQLRAAPNSLTAEYLRRTERVAA